MSELDAYYDLVMELVKEGGQVTKKDFLKINLKFKNPNVG